MSKKKIFIKLEAEENGTDEFRNVKIDIKGNGLSLAKLIYADIEDDPKLLVIFEEAVDSFKSNEYLTIKSKLRN